MLPDHLVRAVQRGWVTILSRPFLHVRYPLLDDIATVDAFTTLRFDGDRALPYEGPEQWLLHHKEAVLDALRSSTKTIVLGRQVHGRCVRAVSAASTPAGEGSSRILSDTDGLATQTPGLAVGVLSADCLPIFLADPCRGAVGIVHSGREGTLQGVSHAALETFGTTFGSRPPHLLAVIGPSIGPCCYPTDLWAANETSLRDAGVGRVVNVAICTSCCVSVCSSHRAEKGAAGRMLSVIMRR